jgi:predicted nuclease of predicted toxin-antitoxin system
LVPKFLSDKNLSHKSVEHISKKLGFDCLRVNEIIKFDRVSDKQIFEFALKYQYYKVTSDYDFGEILSNFTINQPSNIIEKLSFRIFDNVNRMLVKVLPNILLEF